jgi:hypothetical protein
MSRWTSVNGVLVFLVSLVTSAIILWWSGHQAIDIPITIVLSERDASPGFLRRNVDDLVKMAIAAVIGYLLGRL